MELKAEKREKSMKAKSVSLGGKINIIDKILTKLLQKKERIHKLTVTGIKEEISLKILMALKGEYYEQLYAKKCDNLNAMKRIAQKS